MPQDLSHYRLEDEIGRGGMGVVYRAVDTRLGRRVAIKLLPPEATADPGRRRRFIQARAASALNQPHIVTIYEVDEHDGTTFIGMELVDGTPLDRKLAAGPLPIEEALAKDDFSVPVGAAALLRDPRHTARSQEARRARRRARAAGHTRSVPRSARLARHHLGVVK